jgi:hypothetical protein
MYQRPHQPADLAVASCRHCAGPVGPTMLASRRGWTIARRLFLVASDAERLQLGDVLSRTGLDVLAGYHRLEADERIMYTALVDAVVRARSTTVVLSDRALRQDSLLAVVTELAWRGIALRRLSLPGPDVRPAGHSVTRDGHRISIETRGDGPR